MKVKFLFISLLFCLFNNNVSQIIVNNNNPFNNAISLVDSILLGGGVVSSNHTFQGDAIQVGYFNAVNTNLNMDSGVVMSTGDINSLDPNFNGVINLPVNNVSDLSLIHI